MNTEIDPLQPWKLKHDEVILDTPRFKIRRWDTETSAGAPAEYYVHDSLDSVICVCADDEGRVLIEQQYRPPVSKVSTDYPAGKMESDDKSAEDAIRRELLEELGFEATVVTKLAILDKDPGLSTSRLHVFMARGALDGQTNPDDTENIASRFVPAAEVLEMIKRGEMSCAFCVSATYLSFTELGWLSAGPRKG